MSTCTCCNLATSEFVIVMDFVDDKSSPIINKNGICCINNTWPNTASSMVYLLCEEMFFECRFVRRELKLDGDCAFISRFCVCKMHNEILLGRPVSWHYHRVNGIPCDKYKIIPTTDHPLFFPETKDEWVSKLTRGEL